MFKDIEISTEPRQIDFAPPSTFHEIVQNVNNIFNQIKGTIPYQRDLGIDSRVIDLPIDKAIMILQLDFVKQIKKYEPRVKVKEFNWSQTDIINGILKVKVTFDFIRGI